MNENIDWEDKFRALYALGKCLILPINSWSDKKPVFKAYLDNIEIKEDSILSSASATGQHIQSAIEALWQKCVTELKPNQYLVKNAYKENRMAYRWNGFMWEEKPFV